MRRLWLIGAFTLGLILACGPPSLSSQEEWHAENMETLRSISFENPDSQSRLDAEVARIQAEYAALPADGSRSEALQKLRWDTEAVITEFDAMHMEELDIVLADYKATFVGVWQGGGVTLQIDHGFNVAYEKQGANSSSSINAPIQRFERDQFDVGMFGITTTFVIDEAPHLEGDEWKMTLDGVELTRIQ